MMQTDVEEKLQTQIATLKEIDSLNNTAQHLDISSFELEMSILNTLAYFWSSVPNMDLCTMTSMLKKRTFALWPENGSNHPRGLQSYAVRTVSSSSGAMSTGLASH